MGMLFVENLQQGYLLHFDWHIKTLGETDCIFESRLQLQDDTQLDSFILFPPLRWRRAKEDGKQVASSRTSLVL